MLGHVAWDGSSPTSERVLLRTTITNRAWIERNKYVRIEDNEGGRTGFLARVIGGPFFHRAGVAPKPGLSAETPTDGHLLAELEIQGELVDGQPRDTNSRPVPGAPVFALEPNEVADLYGFQGDMLIGNVTGQPELVVRLQSKNKGVLPRNLGIFGTVGSGKSNTAQVLIEEASGNGWAVVVLDVESEYTEMDQPVTDPAMIARLAKINRRPAGLADFHVFHPASCASDKKGSEPFTLRLADFDAGVIGEILQVTIPERNALMDCVEYLLQKGRSKMATSEPEGL